MNTQPSKPSDSARRKLQAMMLSPEGISSMPLAAAIVRVTQLGNSIFLNAEEELATLLSQGHCFPYEYLATLAARADVLDAVLMVMHNNTMPAIFIPQYNRLVDRLELPYMRVEAA